MNTKEFVESLIANGFTTEKDIVGCSDTEVGDLENYLGHKLPREYQEFIKAVGHSAGDFNRGSDFLFKDIFILTEETRNILNDGPFKLPEDAFVIFSHQGYIFSYFRFSDGDDPPVYVYMENEPEPKKWASSFSEYLSKSFEEALNARRNLNKFKGLLE